MDRIIIEDLNIPKPPRKQRPTPTDEYQMYHSEWLRIRKQIRDLEAEASKVLQLRNNSKIEKKLAKQKEYYNTPYKVYVLKLEQGKYYVGITRKLDRRFNKHLTGKGANWTRLYKPIEIIRVVETKLLKEGEAAVIENQITFETAIQYGLDNVRGGGYCQTYPKWPQELYDKAMGYQSI